MAKFTDIMYQEYWSRYQRLIIIVFVGILLVVIGSYLFWYYALPEIEKKNTPNDTSNIPNANRQNKPVEIYFFHVDWCPYCIKSMPEWNKFVAAHNNEIVNGYKVVCINGAAGTNCTNVDNDAQIQHVVQTFGIEHYPTIKMKKDDQIIEFKARVTEDNLSSFINTVL